MGSAIPPVIKIRKFFLFDRIFRALASASGAITTSAKSFAIWLAVFSKITSFSAITPPKALTGSHVKAFKYASLRLSPMATPHGLACLIIAHAGLTNSETNSNAAFVSLRLL